MGSKIGLLTLALLGLACRPGSNLTDTQSLGNFAGNQTVNQCRGNEPLSFDELSLIVNDQGLALQGAPLNAFSASISAVPADLRAAFFGTFSGQVTLTQQQVCGSENVGCWQISEDGEQVVIFVHTGANEAETITNIRHSTVRAFGYVLSEVILKARSMDAVQAAGGGFGAKYGAAGQLTLADSQDLRDSKNLLAYQFLGNIRKSNGKYALSSLQGKVDGRLLDPRLTDDQFTNLWTALSGDPKTAAFSDAIFAETFDSYYCSDATRQEMRTDFAHPDFDLASEYVLIDSQIRQNLSQTQTFALAAAAEPGLGLTAGEDAPAFGLGLFKRRGGLFGNRTPIRNTFRATGNSVRKIFQWRPFKQRSSLRLGRDGKRPFWRLGNLSGNRTRDTKGIFQRRAQGRGLFGFLRPEPRQNRGGPLSKASVRSPKSGCSTGTCSRPGGAEWSTTPSGNSNTASSSCTGGKCTGGTDGSDWEAMIDGKSVYDCPNGQCSNR